MHGLSISLYHNLPHITISKSNFRIGQSLFSILQSLPHPVNFSIGTLLGAISISSLFSFWKLDYFSDMNCLFKEPFISHDFTFFFNPANHIRFFSVILESDIDRGYIHWTLPPFQLEKFQLKISQYVCYIIWESHCTKIIVVRLLKLKVSYPEVSLFVSLNQYEHPNTEQILQFF